MTPTERLIIWNQYEILRLLDKSENDYYAEKQEIVANGYEPYYPQLNPSIVEEPTSAELCEEVEDILDMFRAIKFSCDRLGYTPKSPRANFNGFDANATTGHYGIAVFLRRKQKKWEELADRDDNSHSMASLPSYRAMLKEWRQRGKSFELTASDIEAIADAK